MLAFALTIRNRHTQNKMDKSGNNFFPFLKIIKGLSRWVRRMGFIFLAALMIGFSNAFYDEFRLINDTKNFDEQEQVVDDEDTNE